MTSTILSGLLISKSLLPTLGIQLAASHAWRSIHTLSADASQILLGIHFGLHFKWVLAHLKRYIANPLVGPLYRSKPQRQPAGAVRMEPEASCPAAH